MLTERIPAWVSVDPLTVQYHVGELNSNGGH